MMRIMPHPPDFTSFPWYDLIVRIEGPPTSLTGAVLNAAFNNQTGLATSSGIAFRLQSVRVWGAIIPMNSGNILQPLVVVVLDPIGATAASNVGGTGPRVLQQITDYPNQVSRACIGYRYPKAQREFSFSTNASNTTPLLNMTGVGPGSVLYYHVQWRADNIIVPSLTKADSIEVISLNHPYGCYCTDCRC